jgi:outer membrane protein assembly factor BamB
MKMTEDELRTIIQEKAPADLTPEECAALRSAIRTSPQLFREMADRIQIDEYLARALGRPQVSADRVLARLAARRAGAAGRWSRYGLVVCGVVAAVLAGLMASRDWRGRPPRREMARREFAEPAAAGEKSVGADRQFEPPQPKPPSPAKAPAVEPAPRQPAAPAPAAVPQAVEPLRAAGLFEPPAADDATPDGKALARWFAVVGKLPLKFSAQSIMDRSCGRFEGLARLTRPIVAGAALRMSSLDFSGLRIHVWSGAKGVTFAAFATPLRWQVSATERSGDMPLPTACHTLARDEGRMIRTNPAGIHAVELRYENGMVSLARGDVPLVEAPLEGPPTDVFFEGAATFRDLALVAAVPLPPLRAPAARPAFDLPADLRETWVRGGDPSAGFTVHDDGTATLSAVANSQPAWAMLPLPQASGPREIVVRIENTMPGTGLVFGDGQAAPQSVLMFLADKDGKMPGVLQVRRSPPAAGGIVSPEPLTAASPFMLVRQTLWLRIRQCGGVQRLDMSADGSRWVTGGEPQPAFSALGLYAARHASARSITLAALQQATFSRLEAVCPAELRDSAVELPPQGPLAAWLAAADAAKPPAVDAGQWRRACGLKALAGNAPKELAAGLLGFLFRESLGMEMPMEARRELLDDILALAPVADDPAAAAPIAALFDAAGWRLAADGEPRCYSAIAHEQLTAPLCSGQPFTAFSESLARREIVGLVCSREWNAVASLAEKLAFFGFSSKPRNEAFFAWAAAVAKSRIEDAPTAVAAEWRPPLLVAQGREAVIVEAELNAALDGDDMQEASRLIDAAVAGGQVDLMRDRRDTDLFMSLPLAVETAMQDEPRLLEAMRQDRERIAGLRVLEATAAADEGAVEATTVQFHGTAAAARAHVWLADRCMAAGRFAVALRHYEAAAASIPEDDAELRKRTRAAIDLARQLGGPPAGSAVPRPPALDKATAITATAQDRLAGDIGGKSAGLPAAIAKGGIDWPAHAIDGVARQIAVLPLDDRLLVSNQFQLASHDPETGAMQWRAGLGGDSGAGQDWQGIAMRPVADAERVYVRRLRKAGPAIAAIDRADGAVAWELPSTSDRQFASDPLPAAGGTLAVCVSRRVEDAFPLAIAWLDAATGRVLREMPLVTFASPSRCQLADIDSGLVITASGAVIACDERGRVRWVRRETWLPPKVDGFAALVAHAPPAARDGRLHIVQPGVPGISTLDAASGRVLWRLDDVAVSRIRGIAGGRLVVERIGGVASAGSAQPAAADLIGVDAATGKVAWRYGPAELLDASLVGDEGVIAAVREPVGGEQARVAVLVRLDPATGRETGRWPIAACADPQPFLGPLVSTAGGLRVFFGRGAAAATRDLMLLSR